jgi:hypothetical protein
MASELGLVWIQIQIIFYFETKSNGTCMETSIFAIQPYQNKFTFSKVKANKNFREFIRFFWIGLNLQ